MASSVDACRYHRYASTQAQHLDLEPHAESVRVLGCRRSPQPTELFAIRQRVSNRRHRPRSREAAHVVDEHAPRRWVTDSAHPTSARRRGDVRLAASLQSDLEQFGASWLRIRIAATGGIALYRQSKRVRGSSPGLHLHRQFGVSRSSWRLVVVRPTFVATQDGVIAVKGSEVTVRAGCRH